MDALQRREKVVKGLGLLVGALLFFCFFLPRGLSASWQFGWDESVFRMLIELAMIGCGLVVLACAILPLPRMLKGLASLIPGLILIGAVSIDALNEFADLFETTRWFNTLVWSLFTALAAGLAFNGDSDREHSGRQSLAMIGGAVMLFLALIPIGLPTAQVFTPLTAPFEIWDIGGNIDFWEFFLLAGIALVVCLGPASGALLMLHSAVAVTHPRKRLFGAGPIAGIIFILYQPAFSFLLFLYYWMKADIVFTTFAVNITTLVGPAFMVASGIYWICEAFAQEPDRAYQITPGLGTLVSGRPTPAASIPGTPGIARAERDESSFHPPAAAGSVPARQAPEPDRSVPEPGASWPPRGPAHPEPGPSQSGWKPPEDEGWSSSPGGGWSAADSALPDEEEATVAVDSAAAEKAASAAFLDTPAAALPHEEPDEATQALALDQVEQIAAVDREAPPVASFSPGTPPQTEERTQALDLEEIEQVAAEDRPGHGADWHWQAGAEAWEAQDWDRALHHYQQVLVVQPGRTQAARALADIHYGLGNLDEAERFYRRVLQDWPDDSYCQQALQQIARYRQGSQ